MSWVPNRARGVRHWCTTMPMVSPTTVKRDCSMAIRRSPARFDRARLAIIPRDSSMTMTWMMTTHGMISSAVENRPIRLVWATTTSTPEAIKAGA